MNDKRNTAISYIRFIAMTMIIGCHFFQYYNNPIAWWLNIGVQVFLLVSGFLYGSKEIEKPVKFIKKQFKKILIPYYVFLTIIVLVMFLFDRENINLMIFLKAILCVETIKGIEHLWFVGYILFCYLITPYLYIIKKETESYDIAQMLIIHGAILVFVVVFGIVYETYFAPSKICCYIIGYFIAFYYQKYGKKFLNMSTIFCGVICLPIIIIRVWFEFFCMLEEGSWKMRLFNFFKPYANLFLGVFVFLLLYLALGKARRSCVVKISDKLSYYVYIVHQVFILSSFSLMKITNYNIVNWFIVLIASFLSAYVLKTISINVDKCLKIACIRRKRI